MTKNGWHRSESTCKRDGKPVIHGRLDTRISKAYWMGKNGSLFALPFVSETLAQKDPIGTYVYEAVSAPGKCALLNHAWSDSLYRTGNAEPETDIKQRTICCPYVEWRRRKRWASRLEATWGDSAAWKLSFHSLKNPSNKRVLFTRGSTS